MLVLLVACARIDATFENGAVPGVAVISWERVGFEGTVHVEYGKNEDALDERTPPVDAADGEAYVLGLQGAETYFFRVVQDDGGRRSKVLEGTIEPPTKGAPLFTLDDWNPALACEDGGYVLFADIGNEASGV